MSNHVHYLLKPKQAEDLPRIMHWLNWYTAMCLNRLHKRTGHFWEKRYHSSGFRVSDLWRAMATIRYIHGNPMATGKARLQGFFHSYSNFGIYARPNEDDGLTEWHPAFLLLGQTLDACSARYRRYCLRYRPTTKPQPSFAWGTRLLSGLSLPKRGKYECSEQMHLGFSDSRCQVTNTRIEAVAAKFMAANSPRMPEKKLTFPNNG
jgi:REP-associated tyrosine transposase